MSWHLSYDKNGANKSALGSSRNGNTPKRIKGTHVEVEILTPRHCDVSFEPQLVRKHQTRLTRKDDQILTLYGKGLSTRGIVQTSKEIYDDDADVSATLISRVADQVLEQITHWQSRPLDPIYPIVYLDCIFTKIRTSPGETTRQSQPI